MLANDRAVRKRPPAMAQKSQMSQKSQMAQMSALALGNPAEPTADPRALAATIEDGQLMAVKEVRSAGVPWVEIAAAPGISGQAAWERRHEITAPVGSSSAS